MVIVYCGSERRPKMVVDGVLLWWCSFFFLSNSDIKLGHFSYIEMF